MAPELEEVPLGKTDRFNNLGINSVNRAEIIMTVMEEFWLNVPRIELARAKNIGELPDLFLGKL
ncbi:phosphopantetheine-binding protein [Okeania sp. SIO2B3]|uniref:phosphopantetheine-binding protein n=1 Tax=Okeania sp. SIO2B3 TaxID=2607784 RepID=UPI0013C29969|nr:acyl carrier protein [Okeania sp. SIO2B3]